MINRLILQATIKSVSPLRHTPAGMPVLDLKLDHQSTQSEAETSRQVNMEIEAKIIGQNALIWQHATGRQVEISGFLSQKHQKSSQIIVHIQSIHYIE